MSKNFPESGKLGETFAGPAEVPIIEPLSLKNDFEIESVDKLADTLSEPTLILTPDGSSGVKGSKRQSVAEPNIDPSQIPSVIPISKQGRKNQFNAPIGRHRKAAIDNKKTNNNLNGKTH